MSWACRIIPNNISAIQSEKPGFDHEELLEWYDVHGEGYFIRDEHSPWDCTYMADLIFAEIYEFENDEVEGELFRSIRLKVTREII